MCKVRSADCGEASFIDSAKWEALTQLDSLLVDLFVYIFVARLQLNIVYIKN